METALMIRQARRRAGVTQRVLADRAQTTQSTIAAYESGAKQPSASTLDRVLRAADCVVTWNLRSVTSLVPSAVGRISGVLAAKDEAAALRLAADLATAFAALDPARLRLEIETDPGTTGDDRWDALLAGVVERAAHQAAVPTPSWTAAPGRFLAEWWFLSPYRSLHASALVDAPAELANRGVFVHAASLVSV